MVAFSSFPFFANFGPSWLTPPPSELDVFIFRPDSMHCLAHAGFQTLRSILGFRCWVTPCKALYRRRCTQTGILAPPFFFDFSAHSSPVCATYLNPILFRFIR
jgi:hypothetical protein